MRVDLLGVPEKIQNRSFFLATLSICVLHIYRFYSLLCLVSKFVVVFSLAN